MRLFALLATASLGGCFFMDFFQPLTSSSSSNWYETGPLSRPRDEVWRAARELLVRSGYNLPAADPRAGVFETNWDTHLAMHWREGFRTKVEVAFVDVPGGTNVHIRSYREINNNSTQPHNAEKADWIGASNDDKQAERIPEPAIRLQQQLKLKFTGLSQ